MPFSDSLPPLDLPWPLPTDDPREFPTEFAAESWPVMWQRLVMPFTNSAARDAAVSGLGTTDRAFAYLEDSKTLWRWTGSAWALATPWTQSGSQTVAAVADGANLDVTFTFPVAFTATGYTPYFIPSANQVRLEPALLSRSTGSMSIRFYNFSGATSVSGTVNWSATLNP